MKNLANKQFKMKDLMKMTRWKEVERALIYHYDYGKKKDRDTLKRYKEIFEELRDCEDMEQEDPKERIKVNAWIEESFPEDEEDYIESYDISTNKYALTFRPWRELANIKVRRKNLLTADIVAIFLWEITFLGFSEADIEEEAEEVNRRIKELM